MEARAATSASGQAPTPHSSPDVSCDAFILTIYERYGTLLLRYAARLLDGDCHKAEDILQETVVRAWKNAHYLSTRDELVRPWLFTVVRNLVIDHHRSQRLRPLELMAVVESDATCKEPENLLTLHMVLEALQELAEQQRTIIKLMYYLECSVAQAAQHLGIPPGTVKSRAFYALRALRKVLEERGVVGR
ncbi:sigma-70 family RNA polymerase sigma factor [Streptomyces sp. NEAU-W12]|uniref:sigma-70 family RNA polymerase sigma factor n=1 Tax=Streptomyces sp. NEAU-W12 TaxID=2994668 RepID=UPI00224A7A15|nr:sigma-70 family RNA polymerase sigma factor [Streptomyces sp. NEAU-W12]MCX2928375.1 sigma-70 family RNA polymerase sigma factor [Streptomyces sp. NEAU-W12]